MTDMPASARSRYLSWTIVAPLLAVIVLALAWGRDVPPAIVALVTALLAGAVLAAVHHAEVVALRVGEPYGSLVLAVAVTVIEVALIVTLMVAGAASTETLARDTVFAAVIITCNGIVGPVDRRGTRAARSCRSTPRALVQRWRPLPRCRHSAWWFRRSRPAHQGRMFSPPQLAFAAVAAIGLYGLFVTLQTGRHRDYFLPVTADGTALDGDHHAAPPSTKAALTSLALLLIALVAVVGNAKLVSPTIERAVSVPAFLCLSSA